MLKILIVISAALLTSACIQKEDAVIPQDKEGDVVTWRGNQLLIIKTVIGQRRLHTDKSFENIFEYENFIGQFPIDYVPKLFPKLTEKEAAELEVAEEKRLKKDDLRLTQDIEFNLMLNGSTVEPTNEDPIGKNLDHPDQIKVRISRYELGSADFYFKRGDLAKRFQGELDAERERSLDLMKRLDAATKISKAGVDCYEYKERLYKEGAMRDCFAPSDTPLAQGYHFYVGPGNKVNDIQVNRYTPGYTIFWYMDKKNIYRAKEIDAAIWRLLDTWNVSPYQTPVQ
jgi:hypothetical protein